MSDKFNTFDLFQNRHIGPDATELQQMLQTVGVSSLDELISETIPTAIRLEKPLPLPAAISEYQLLQNVRKLSQKNQIFKSYIGLGFYNSITPSVILRNIFENPGWYTQYTPYQAEISQGRLEALLIFQTMVSDLTGLPVANASLLDEATAAAEAMSMIHRLNIAKTKNKQNNVFLVSESCFPQTISVLKTRSAPHDIELRIAPISEQSLDERVFGILLQYPDANGEVEDYRTFIERAHQNQSLVAVATDLLSLTLLTPPGEIGADIALGSAQRFGVPMGFGGPNAAFFACRDEYKRQMPGRIIGISIDRRGNKGYRMALQTREQHIRREKATSNICTAQALLAIMAGMYAVWHGPEGLKTIAERIHTFASHLANELTQLGFQQLNQVYFDTLKIKVPSATTMKKIRKVAESEHINFRYIDERHIGIALDETVTTEDVEAITNIFAKAVGKTTHKVNWRREPKSVIPAPMQRTTPYLTHSVFRDYHSEHKMVRYLKTLEKKDLSLTTSMIPLGSCTMKLTGTTTILPVSWPEFAHIHPYVPEDQAAGYLEMIDELGKALCKITGFAAVTFQPNSGAQGEYTGLMVIRAYHHDHGQPQRNVTLIPCSAHGTNPASAVMAGQQVVVVACDDRGNIDIADLKAKAEQYKDTLSALMVTYPSTHGVFEENIAEICNIIHANGGLVYMDGANMNAQVGLTSPAKIGADVCHLNLHKTFAIPHGGGGPGMGPICVAKHLVPYLPQHPLLTGKKGKAITAVSNAPYGSASILLISYAYIKLLGGEGLTTVSKYAILNANYIKARLEKHYKVLYTGEHGRVGHELIFDLHEFKPHGIEAEDIAKRLMDYNFHAPTVSFPVLGTLMVEPTESEDKGELDRFCDALLQIREEIQEIIDGKADKMDNVLKNAPHTAAEVCSDQWNHGYSREKAAFPLPYLRQNKFWPAVARIDNTYGDRNLVCVCM